MSDAAALWKLHASRADGERILQNLRLLDDALGQSDLVRVFERLGIDA